MTQKVTTLFFGGERFLVACDRIYCA